MISTYSVGLCVFLNTILLLCQGYPRAGTDGLGFSYQEEQEQNAAYHNAMNKRPVLFPSRCKPGELYYPGDQGDDWVCDCKPGYVFYPQHNQCYGAFTRGPCRENHEYLTLPSNSVIPKCTRNPCGRDNWVHFRNGNVCYELGKAGPCPVPEIDNVVTVNETTLEIVCSKTFDVGPRLGEETNSTHYNKKECFAGGQRYSNFRCPQQSDLPFDAIL